MATMRITVLFFSFAADRMNARERAYELEAPLTVAEFFEQSLARPLGEPLAAWLFSVNQEWVSPEYLLREGDEMAVVPPVSGG